jgi:hypothetical protein
MAHDTPLIRVEVGKEVVCPGTSQRYENRIPAGSEARRAT